MQLVASQPKFQIAGAKCRVGITYRLPGSAIPNNDFAGTVLFGRNGALESRIGNRMIFNGDGHAFVFGIETRPFRNGPTFHGAFELQAQVVMQLAGPVLLNDKRTPAVATTT